MNRRARVIITVVSAVLLLVRVTCWFGDDWDRRHELGDPMCGLDG